MPSFFMEERENPELSKQVRGFQNFLFEGGDREWLFIYLSYIIGNKCEQNMSAILNKSKIYKGILKIFWKKCLSFPLLPEFQGFLRVRFGIRNQINEKSVVKLWR